MKYLIVPLVFFFQFSYAVEEEITSWFNQESEKFLEIMNNSDGQNNENYYEYVKFVEKNFEYVEQNFANKVREVYYDKNSKKNIYGKATKDEKDELKEEGIDLVNIPWVDKDN